MLALPSLVWVIGFPTFAAAVLGLGVWLAAPVAVQPGSKPDDGGIDFNSRWWRIVAAVWFSLCLGGVVARTVMNKKDGGPDAAALGFLLLGLIVFVVPLVSKLTLPGGGGIEFFKREAKKDAVTNYEGFQTALADMAALTRRLMAMQFELQQNLARTEQAAVAKAAMSGTGPPDLSPVARVAFDECVRVMGTCLPWLVATGESHRVTVWWNVAKDSYAFVVGCPEKTMPLLAGTRYDPVVGHPAFESVEHAQTRNYANVPAAQHPPAGADLTAMLVIPIVRLGRTRGLLLVERSAPDRFDANAQSIATALACWLGVALTNPATLRAAPALDYLGP